MRGAVGHDVAQAVCERLWRELKAGKHRDGRWPFRVIVHQVIGYVCAGWYETGLGRERADRDRRRRRRTFTGDVELQPHARGSSSRRCRRATARSARLWLLERLETDEIAERLGKKPNAIYQARRGSSRG